MVSRLWAITPSRTRRSVPAGPQIATALEAVAALQDTDAALAADPPALPAPGPALPFVRAPGRRPRLQLRQDDPSHAAHRGGALVGRGAEAAIGGRQCRRAAEDLLVGVQR